MRFFENKVSIVTGAASGIGRETAILLAEEGSNLAISDINEKGLKEVEQICRKQGRNVSAHVADVADRAAMQKFVKDVIDRHHAADILINNAGVTVFDTVKDGSVEDFEWILGINLWGTYYGCKFFLPYLSQSKDAAIVNISSIFGFAGIPTQAYYCTTKFAVRGFTDALRLELAQSDPHVHVCCVHPGTIDTNIVRNGRFLNKTILGDTKEELAANFHKMAMTGPLKTAKAIVEGIRKKRKRIRIGIDSKLIDVICRLFPKSYPAIILPLFKKPK